jgi:hypothetical protein
MPEYLVSFPEEKHTAMVNGSFMDDREGDALSEFSIHLLDSRAQILEIIANKTMGVVATFALSPRTVDLILDLEKELSYNVTYDQLHHGHTFPTFPPVTIRLLDH